MMHRAWKHAQGNNFSLQEHGVNYNAENAYNIDPRSHYHIAFAVITYGIVKQVMLRMMHRAWKDAQGNNFSFQHHGVNYEVENVYTIDPRGQCYIAFAAITYAIVKWKNAHSMEACTR